MRKLANTSRIARVSTSSSHCLLASHTPHHGDKMLGVKLGRPKTGQKQVVVEMCKRDALVGICFVVDQYVRSVFILK